MNYTAKKYNTKKLVLLAMFSALAYATMFVFRIKVSFLTFEARNAVITIARHRSRTACRPCHIAWL